MTRNIVCSAATILFVAFSSAQAHGTVLEEALETVLAAGGRTVGVVPIAQVESDGGSDATQSKYRTVGMRWAGLSHDQLVQMARSGPYAGKFAVAPRLEMEQAFGGADEAQLRDPAFLQTTGKEAKLDFLIMLSVSDVQATRLMARVAVVNVSTGETVYEQFDLTSKTLSLEAYSGESWELRRWVTGADGTVRLENISMDLGSPDAFGTGHVYEGVQLAALRADLPHPLLDSECPYRIEVFVDRAARQPVEVGRRLYVPLSQGDHYAIRIRNNSPRPVYVALYVDGVNTISQGAEGPEEHRFETPDETPAYRTWRISEKKVGVIAGWWSRDVANSTTASLQQQQPFVVASADESLAASLGSRQRVGMITAVFFAYGNDDVPQAESLVTRSGIEAMLGTAGGQQAVVTLSLDNSLIPKGPMLAAMTVHYASPEALQAILKREDEDGADLPDETEAAPDDGGTSSDGDRAEADETVAAPET